MRIPVTICVVLVVLAGVAGPASAAPLTATDAPSSTASLTSTDAVTEATPDAQSAQTTQSAPPDPEEDVLGWEDGYWYNESITVDRSDGLNDSELDAVVARSAARVEHVRQLEFESIPPVEVISRAEYRERNAERFGNSSETDALHQNVKYEAVFMAGESTDALSELEENRGSSVLGYYSTREKEIVIVGEDTESPQLNEITLSQELYHSLQDQRWNLSSYNRSTTEQNNAVNGIVEGDGNYVDHLYQQECDDGSWGDCLLPQGGQAGGGGGDLNIGMYVISFQPYSDGPPFVEGIRESGGWDAVNAVYEDAPASTEQTIHPAKYGEDAPTELEIADRSNDEWNVLELDGGIDHVRFGEAGMFAMLWYPSYQASQQQGSAQTVAIPYQQFLNIGPNGNVQSFDPYNYDHEYTAGWDGDRLLPYVTDDSASTNETGYVWKTEWDSADDATEFVEGYRTVLDYHGAEQVGQSTYRIPDDQPYGDAFHVMVDGSTVTIVNAPTVDALAGVDDRVAVQEVTTITTAAGGDGDSTTGGDGTDGTDGDTGDGDGTGTTNTTGPGFGVVGALAALLAALGLRRRRA